MSESKLDCKGLRCPMPIVRLSQALRKMSDGDRIEVEATDAAFEPDLQAWARQLGHSIISFQSGDVQRAIIEKGASGHRRPING